MITLRKIPVTTTVTQFPQPKYWTYPEWWVGYFCFIMRMHTVLHMLHPQQPVIIVRIMTKTDDIFILHVLTDHVDTDVPSISVRVQHM